MAFSIASFTGQQAPCGRVVDGESFEDRDEEIAVTREALFACGCRSVRHEYHDGTLRRTVIHHDGRVLEDELCSAE